MRNTGRVESATFVEILTPQGSRGEEDWCLTSVSKVYDQDVKGFIFLLDSSFSRISFRHGKVIPSTPKVKLPQGLNVLIMQIRISIARDFAVEFALTVGSLLGNPASRSVASRRIRVLLSTSFSIFKADPLHIQVPLRACPRDVWLHLTINLGDIVHDEILSIDSVSVCSHCRLRRMFLTSSCLNEAEIPEKFAFHSTVPYNNILVPSDSNPKDSTDKPLSTRSSTSITVTPQRRRSAGNAAEHKQLSTRSGPDDMNPTPPTARDAEQFVDSWIPTESSFSSNHATSAELASSPMQGSENTPQDNSFERSTITHICHSYEKIKHELLHNHRCLPRT